MEDADFNPFDDDVDAPHTPRVNLSYQDEAARGTSRASRTIEFDRLVTIGKALLVIVFLLAYPAMAVLGHQIDDSEVVLDDRRHWAVQDLGVSATLIARELDGPGWAADRHAWHPQSRLTALPAWQINLLAALADHGRLIIAQLGEQRDQDLIAAVRLLAQEDGQDLAPRLLAANEALSRYDDRVAAGITAQPEGLDALIGKLEMAHGWAGAKHAELVAVASPGDGWIASREAVEAVYGGKAIAHVAHEILAASGRDEGSLIDHHSAREALDEALEKWRRAAILRPIFVANQSGDSISGTSHPAMMAFRLSEAQRATEALVSVLQAPLAEADTVDTAAAAPLTP